MIPEAGNSGVRMSSHWPGEKSRKVVLFSGHMIDASDRRPSRFPADKEPTAAFAIDRTLTEIGVSAGDIAICGGACGGDLLFAEASLKRDLLVEIYIPFGEPAFLENSVDFAGGNWHGRFLSVRSRATLHIMPNELPSTSFNENPYERNNGWMLRSAAEVRGAEITVVALWDGKEGSPGGTGHFVSQARRQTGNVYWLDTRTLWD
ncbi:hypothetical protein AB9F42_28425 [Rhizobium leguminosarum]|uniref:hypothetical protein n=1 Tax=Rhizobium leguminosarum TaxID=384 RepID=UPI003F9C3CA0